MGVGGWVGDNYSVFHFGIDFWEMNELVTILLLTWHKMYYLRDVIDIFPYLTKCVNTMRNDWL